MSRDDLPIWNDLLHVRCLWHHWGNGWARESFSFHGAFTFCWLDEKP